LEFVIASPSLKQLMNRLIFGPQATVDEVYNYIMFVMLIWVLTMRTCRKLTTSFLRIFLLSGQLSVDIVVRENVRNTAKKT